MDDEAGEHDHTRRVGRSDRRAVWAKQSCGARPDPERVRGGESPWRRYLAAVLSRRRTASSSGLAASVVMQHGSTPTTATNPEASSIPTSRIATRRSTPRRLRRQQAKPCMSSTACSITRATLRPTATIRTAAGIPNTRPYLREPATPSLRSEPAGHRSHPVEHALSQPRHRHAASRRAGARRTPRSPVTAWLGARQSDRRLCLVGSERGDGKP